MCVCVCVCVHACACTLLHECVCVCVCVCSCTHACMQITFCVCVYLSVIGLLIYYFLSVHFVILLFAAKCYFPFTHLCLFIFPFVHSLIMIKIIPLRNMYFNTSASLQVHSSIHTLTCSSVHTCFSSFSLYNPDCFPLQIPDSISHLDNLEVLILSNNRIRTVNRSVFRLPKLMVLDLSNNDIEAVSSELSGLLTLTQLILNGNKMDTMPGSIGFMKELRVLGVNENRLQEVRSVLIKSCCVHF